MNVIQRVRQMHGDGQKVGDTAEAPGAFNTTESHTGLSLPQKAFDGAPIEGLSTDAPSKGFNNGVLDLSDTEREHEWAPHEEDNAFAIGASTVEELAAARAWA